MVTRFTKITPKDIQILQGISNYESARRSTVVIRDSLGVKDLLVCHLANYWGVSDAEIIATLSGKKTA